MLLIVADDFTGALDTGVNFAECGMKTKVITTYPYNFKKLDETVQVLVIDAETRHLSGKEAYERVFGIVTDAQEFGISKIFKKTDSVLRGNIGSELTAAVDAAAHGVLHFFPAFPSMGRTTIAGTHYVNGQPISESAFGKDMYNPVKYSYIPDIIAQQSEMTVKVISDKKLDTETQRKEIAVYDTTDNQQMEYFAQTLCKSEEAFLIAGCAGIASTLAKEMGDSSAKTDSKEKVEKFFVFCGSVNPVTQKQLDYAEQHGFYRMRLLPEECLEKAFFQSERGKKRLEEILKSCKEHSVCMIDTNDRENEMTVSEYAKRANISTEEVRVHITYNLGSMIKIVLAENPDALPFITGGDTLLSFMEQMGIGEIIPLKEAAQGTVLSEFEYCNRSFQALSKSGGFGSEQLLVDLAKAYLDESKQEELL